MSTTVAPRTPQGRVVGLGIPDSSDYPRLVFTAPYFEQVPLAEIIEPSVQESVESLLPSLVPPYVDAAAANAVTQLAVQLTGSTMTGPLFLSPVMPTQPAQAASMAYVDAMIATAGIPEVPAVPTGQTWARQTGQWVPITETGGVFLPLAGGTMQGAINMSGNTITNMAALPVMPNGAAPAQWVLNQISAQSLYQGTWTPDTNTPDLTQPGTHQNGFTWIVTTTTVGGVVVSQPIPGLQGTTVYNGDTVIYSAIAGQFQTIHAGGLTIAEAQALFLQLAGGQMSGPLLLNANATQPMQAVTLQQLDDFVPPGAVGEAPTDGQLYGRNGLTHTWSPVLGLGGGILTGALTLAGNATTALQPTTLQQMTAALGNYVPLSGNATIAGPITMGNASATLTLGANAATAMQAVPLQQLTTVLGGYLALTGGTMTGSIQLNGNASQPLQPVTLQQMQTATGWVENYIDNSGFTVSQRAAMAGGTWAAGTYFIDRWKAGAAGGTYSVTPTPASTVVSITAGSLQQVVLGNSLITASYTLSWQGTAQGRIATTSGGGTYGASPLTVAATGGANLYVEFNTGTVSQVKLQLGSAATAWEPQPPAVEMHRCQRFFYQSNIGTPGTALWGVATAGGQTINSYVDFPVTMNATPTVTPFWGAFTNVQGGSAGVTGVGQNGCQPFYISNGAGSTLSTFLVQASCEP